MPPFSSPRAGQKRKIDEVHEDSLAGSQSTGSLHPLSQVTDVLSDVHAELEETVQIAIGEPLFTLNSVSTSFRVSQDEPAEIEAEFEIHEEPSQQTLDKMVWSYFQAMYWC